MEEYKRIKRIKGHSGIVNSIHFERRGWTLNLGMDLIVSGSDDNTAKVWDTR